MTPNDHDRSRGSAHRKWLVTAAFAALGVGVASYFIVDAAFGSGGSVSLGAPADAASDSQAGQIIILSGRNQVPPRQPTADECTKMTELLEASVPGLRQSHIEGARGAGVPESQINADLRAFDSSVARSRAWIAEGCPAHDKLGVIDTPSGGRELRLLDTFALGGSLP